MKRLMVRPQAGFTLIETLLSMALMSIFLLVLTDIFTQTLSLQTENEAASVVTQDGRYIMQRLAYDVARASAITTPAVLGGSGSTLALTIDGVANTYSVSGGNLQVVNGAGTTALNGNGTTVSGLTVQRLGDGGQADTARVMFTVTSKATPQSGPATQTLTITVGRR